MNSPQFHEDTEIDRLLAKIARLERRVRELEAQRTADSWRTNPDRSGGAFTEDEKAGYWAWR